MLDRRSTRDDHRGLEQGVIDNLPTETAVLLLLEASSVACTAAAPNSSMPLRPSLLSHHLSAQLSYPPVVLVALPQQAAHLPSPALNSAGGASEATAGGGLGLASSGSAGGVGGSSAGLHRRMGREEGSTASAVSAAAAESASWRGFMAPMGGPLPCDVHLVSLKWHRPMQHDGVRGKQRGGIAVAGWVRGPVACAQHSVL